MAEIRELTQQKARRLGRAKNETMKNEMKPTSQVNLEPAAIPQP